MSGAIALRTPGRPRPPAWRGPVRVVLRLVTLVVGLATASVVLGPSGYVAGGRSVADVWLAAHPTAMHLVGRLGGVEAAGNLVLFAPFGFFLALSVRRGLLLPTLLLALLASPAAEFAQRFLPGRVPDGADIWRNSVGLSVAFACGWLLRLVVAPARPSPPR